MAESLTPHASMMAIARKHGIGTDRMVNESHVAWRDRAPRDILKRMRHDGCGGRVAKPELLTGINGSSRSVRWIVLRG